MTNGSATSTSTGHSHQTKSWPSTRLQKKITSMDLQTAIERLNRASSKLKTEQGRIARKNARQTFLSELRNVRSAVDSEFPAIRKPRRQARRRAQPGKADDLHLIYMSGVQRAQTAGIKVIWAEKKPYVKKWVRTLLEFDTSIARLKLANRSKKYRTLLETAALVGESPNNIPLPERKK